MIVSIKITEQYEANKVQWPK